VDLDEPNRLVFEIRVFFFVDKFFEFRLDLTQSQTNVCAWTVVISEYVELEESIKRWFFFLNRRKFLGMISTECCFLKFSIDFWLHPLGFITVMKWKMSR
jgi:hypothetical protein